MRYVTVIERVRLLGLEPEKHTMWELGNRVRDAYEIAYGELPPKALRPKINDKGTHCFAIYPPEFVPMIDNLIKMVEWEESRQMDMFL